MPHRAPKNKPYSQGRPGDYGHSKGHVRTFSAHGAEWKLAEPRADSRALVTILPPLSETIYTKETIFLYICICHICVYIRLSSLTLTLPQHFNIQRSMFSIQYSVFHIPNLLSEALASKFNVVAITSSATTHSL
jgi:hypothetical protein